MMEKGDSTTFCSWRARRLGYWVVIILHLVEVADATIKGCEWPANAVRPLLSQGLRPITGPLQSAANDRYT